MVVAGVDVVDVCCAHGACGVVPPVGAPLGLCGSRWWGGGWVEACAFVVCFCENLFPDFVPVCWQALTSVGCGPWHVCRVPGGVWVVGWLVDWWGLWFGCRVSGWGWVLGLGCLVGGGVWGVSLGVGLWSYPVCWVVWITPVFPAMTEANLSTSRCGKDACTCESLVGTSTYPHIHRCLLSTT